MSVQLIRHPRAPGKAVTKQYDFFNATPDGDKLFSVRGGIPLDDAFNQLSLLLAAGNSALDDACASISANEVSQAPWAAKHVLEFAYSLVQSMHEGLIKHELSGENAVSPSDD